MVVSQTRILYVEDDENMSMLVTNSLGHEGFVVLHYKEAISAIRAFRSGSADIVILDVMMDGVDGFDLAIQIRRVDPQVPIIFVTAKIGINDVLTGFDIGARDYLKKPFEIEELIVRIKIQLEHRNERQETVMIGCYSFNYRRQELTSRSRTIRLSYREAGLLRKLVSVDGNLVTRAALIEEFWQDKNFFTGRSLDVFISKLRSRFKEDPAIEIISVRNIGYQLRVNG